MVLLNMLIAHHEYLDDYIYEVLCLDGQKRYFILRVNISNAMLTNTAYKLLLRKHGRIMFTSLLLSLCLSVHTGSSGASDTSYAGASILTGDIDVTFEDAIG